MIRYLSVEGDRETIYLWREQTTRGSKGGPGTGYQKMQGILRKKRFVFFSCRICTDIDPACESQELEDRVFRTYSESIDYKNHPRPETSHFSDELEHMKSGTEDGQCTSRDMETQALAASAGTGLLDAGRRRCRSEASP